MHHRSSLAFEARRLRDFFALTETYTRTDAAQSGQFLLELFFSPIISPTPPGPSGECIRRIRDVGGIVRNSTGQISIMMLYLLDLVIVLFALAACVLWFRASRKRLRRLSKHEAFDHTDYNRLVTALNRTQILNAHAALATGIATGLAAVRLVFSELVQ